MQRQSQGLRELSACDDRGPSLHGVNFHHCNTCGSAHAAHDRSVGCAVPRQCLNFSFLATDTSSPYFDTSPVKTPGQAEWRDYRACWWDNDIASMAFGPVLRVLVTG